MIFIFEKLFLENFSEIIFRILFSENFLEKIRKLNF
jgi:hypothetical protein